MREKSGGMRTRSLGRVESRDKDFLFSNLFRLNFDYFDKHHLSRGNRRNSLPPSDAVFPLKISRCIFSYSARNPSKYFLGGLQVYVHIFFSRLLSHTTQ